MRSDGIYRASAGVLLALLMSSVSGCSSMGPLLAPDAPQSNDVAPAVASITAAQAADEIVIGIIGWPEAENLSGGSIDATTKAARLAIEGLTLRNTSFVIYDEQSAGSGAALGKRFVDADVSVVVGGATAGTMSEMATVLDDKSVPTLTLASISDTSLQLYSAALNPRSEASALVREARFRGLTRIGIVSGTEAGSASLAGIIAQMALEQAIGVQIISGADEGSFVRDMAEGTQAGALDALVFITSPQSAVRLLQTGGIASVNTQIVGNASWALAEPLPAVLRSAWYPSLPMPALSTFRERYRNTFNETPTLSAAILYDLVIMAAALSQREGGQDYSSATLKNASGFRGFTGPFAFGAVGLIEDRSYNIVSSD